MPPSASTVARRALTREVLRCHLRPFLWTLIGLTGLLFLKTILNHRSALAATTTPEAFLVGLILPLAYILPLTLPLAIVAATLYAPMRLAKLSSNGLAPPLSHVASPVLAWATALAFLSLFWQDAILPRTNRLLRGVYATGVVRSAQSGIGDREMSLIELQAAMSLARASAAAANAEQRPALLRRVAGFEVEFHKKFATAGACAFLAALGLVLGRLTGGGYLLAFGGTIIVAMVYYVGLIAGEPLGNRGILHPAVVMWGSDILVVLTTLVAAWWLPPREHSQPAPAVDGA